MVHHTPVLGIDIAKKTFQCALLRGKKYKEHSFNNTPQGYQALSAWLKKQGVTTVQACLEATGSYGEGIATYLAEQPAIVVSVVNPAKIKGFAQCQLQRLKTDKADAQLIAQYCDRMQPPAWKPTPLPVRQLQALVRRVEDLNQLLRQEENRALVAQAIVQPSLHATIATLTDQIQQLRQQIHTHIQHHPDLKEKADLLKSIPGVGEATQAQVLAFLGQPERFDNAKQCAAFVGLNPRLFASGTSVKGKTRLSKTGAASLRKAFYMPALVAMKYNPLLRAFAERLKQAGKQSKVIICAIMRKLVHLIYGILKSKQPFTIACSC